jgi:hypothetical protein
LSHPPFSRRFSILSILAKSGRPIAAFPATILRSRA